MKLKTAALIAIVGNSLAMILWLLSIWKIIILTEHTHQIFFTATNIFSNVPIILFMILFFNKAK